MLQPKVNQSYPRSWRSTHLQVLSLVSSEEATGKKCCMGYTICKFKILHTVRVPSADRPAVKEDDHRLTQPSWNSLGLPLLFAVPQDKTKVLISRTIKQFLIEPSLIPSSSISWKSGTEHHCCSQVGLGALPSSRNERGWPYFHFPGCGAYSPPGQGYMNINLPLSYLDMFMAYSQQN